MINHILILTEGGTDKGFGHIIRCTSICQCFEDLGIYVKLCINSDGSERKIIGKTDYVLCDWLSRWKEIDDKLDKYDIVFVDSYLADLSIYENIIKHDVILVCIDDNCRIRYPDHSIVLNSNVHANNIFKEKNPNITYMLGCKYTMLRKSFWKLPFYFIKKSVSDILITLGGISYRKFVTDVVKNLQTYYHFWTYHIIVPDRDYDFYNSLFAVNYVNLYRDLNGYDMMNLITRSDLCISAGGQALYELARVGIPTIGICVADNQLNNLNELANAGFVKYVGKHTDDDIFRKIISAANELSPQHERSERFKNGRNIVHGYGAKKVCEFLMEKVNGKK